MDTYQGDLENPLSLHKYLYCDAAPIMRTDLSGHDGDLDTQLGTTGIIGNIAGRFNYVVLKALNVASRFPTVTKVVIGTQTLLTWWGISQDPDQAALYLETGGVAADFAFLRSIGNAIKGVVAMYKGLNSLKQAEGAVAILTQDSIKGGSKALQSIEPPGWNLLPTENRARAHLLGNALGGEGSTPENLVSMFQSSNLRMKNYEMQVKRAVQAGEKVDYAVTPIYGSNPFPDVIHIFAKGDKGLNIDVTVPNIP